MIYPYRRARRLGAPYKPYAYRYERRAGVVAPYGKRLSSSTPTSYLLTRIGGGYKVKPYVITIARQYGSGGKTVGKMLADKLGIPFYNREIITMASEDSGVNAMLFSDERLKGDFLTRLRAHYHGNTPVPNDSSKSYLKDEALFAYQVKIIRRLADQGPCVMIGRCADYILAGRPDVVRVFVHADKAFCLEQAMKVDSLPENEVAKKIAEIDEYRARYYKHHTGHDWYDARNYDLSLNSGVLGFDGTVEEIIKYMEVREQFQK